MRIAHLYPVIFTILCLVMFVIVACRSEPEASLTAPSSCLNVKEIPTLECEALVALFNTSGGPNWDLNSGWLVTKAPCSWYGVTCDAGHVAQLDLSFNDLSGSIPTELGNMPNLTDLSLSANQLSGSIPAELGNLSNLLTLELDGNELSGSMPAELGNLSNLTDLDLDGNELSGSIPAELGNLSNLNSLDLRNNELNGSIPAELGNLSNLWWLSLGSNELSGSIPAELGNLSNLSTLYLYDNKLLSGPLPQNMTKLNLGEFLFSDTGLCEPLDVGFQAWLSSIIVDLQSTGMKC